MAGPEWDAQDEAPVARIPAGGATALSTAYAPMKPGNAATYKVFTVLKNGAERGSKAVTVTRPLT